MKESELFYTIGNEVFTLEPGYMRGVVLAYGLINGGSSQEVTGMLRDAEAGIRTQLDLETLVDHPRVASWREAYRAFGAKPNKFRPSMEAMARRVLKNQELPSINTLVDLGNIISLRHVIPVGGHAIDFVSQDIVLRSATGEEEFVPFGSDQVENPLSGEIILVEGNIAITRRWTWRQANHTLTLPTTAAIEFNVDGLPPVPYSEIEAACRELGDLVVKYCGGRTRFNILTKENPRIKISE